MNKQEKLMALVFGLALVGYFFYSTQAAKRQAAAAAEARQAEIEQAQSGTNAAPAALTAPAVKTQEALPEVPPAATLAKPDVPEQTVRLASGKDLVLELSSWGGVIRKATFCDYATDPGKIDPEKNPAYSLDFADAPGLELAGFPGLAQNAGYAVSDKTANAVTFTAKTAQGLVVTRTVALETNYIVRVRDTFRNAGESVLALGTNSIAMGTMGRGASKNDILSMDTLPTGDKAKVRFWDRERETKKLMVGVAGGFGCGGAPSAAGMADQQTIPVAEPQAWLALKNRFFVNAFMSDAANSGFAVTLARDTSKDSYSLKELSARVFFTGGVLGQGETLTRSYTLFIGPKKLSLLRQMDHQMKEIMQFGWFGWFCELLVPTLNFFYRIIPNYGIAIILLTFLVRIVFWPLTHKGTVSMKKMSEVQPELKEIQKKYKDNPQKMQQETWAVYRKYKVNPLSSCLPMLIQIPVFIALFTVLRSAVELRYAPFLWIADLSEAENLFAGVLPIPLNILPILMAVTTGLQSYLTPSTGDAQQQRMMMIIMPAMMLVMFYSFPSALSLYWTVSQVISIVQMVMIQRQSKRKNGSVPPPPDQPLTRQQRRHGAAPQAN
jgi:YidC/Oxa1 family membrane protein insertase